MATARGLTSGAYLELDVALERGLQVSALSADTRRRGRVDRAPATGGADGAAKARVTIWRDFTAGFDRGGEREAERGAQHLRQEEGGDSEGFGVRGAHGGRGSVRTMRKFCRGSAEAPDTEYSVE